MLLSREDINQTFLEPVRFHQAGLAEHAGVTRQTVGNYTDLMCEVELIEDVPNTSPRRYRVADSDVVRERFELNSALNSVGE